MHRSLQHTGGVAVALLVAACAHNEAGMGTGFAGSGAATQPVEFSWKSSDAGQTGTMSAVVGSRTFPKAHRLGPSGATTDAYPTR
jgi:hypothetical protein